MALPRLTIALVAIAATLTLAGCKSSSNTAGAGTLTNTAPSASATPAGTPTSAATSTAAPATTAATPGTTAAKPPTTPATTGTSSSPVVGSGPDYDNARTQWKDGAAAISASQPLYWLKAVVDLGEASADYSKQITELTELSLLPDAQQTPAQNTKYHADITALNAFFNTPGLYS